MRRVRSRKELFSPYENRLNWKLKVMVFKPYENLNKYNTQELIQAWTIGPICIFVYFLTHYIFIALMYYACSSYTDALFKI